jgi:peptide-methionine (S)-S-oxide reductase
MWKKMFFFTLSLFGLSACQQKNSLSNAQNNNQSSVEIVKNMEKMELATLGAGCFWCVEAVFQDLEGVEKVESGYAGGTVKNPTYKQVCEGTTGAAEVTRIIFDPSKISFEQILEVFFQTHNPTTLNRQGGDAGTQYRSAIFYHSEAQKKTAEASIIKAAELWSDPIVTEISPLPDYYPAEDYHQNYFNLNANKNPYCSAVIVPKVDKFRKQFKPLLKSELKN